MGLFNRSAAPADRPLANEQVVEDRPVERRSSLFGGRRHEERRAEEAAVADGATNGHHRGFLHRNPVEDASIIAAKERVASAEAAERDADRALVQARTAVRAARDHVKRLEREVVEE